MWASLACLTPSAHSSIVLNFSFCFDLFCVRHSSPILDISIHERAAERLRIQYRVQNTGSTKAYKNSNITTSGQAVFIARTLNPPAPAFENQPITTPPAAPRVVSSYKVTVRSTTRASIRALTDTPAQVVTALRARARTQPTRLGLTRQAGHEPWQGRSVVEPKIDALSHVVAAHDLFVRSAHEFVRHRTTGPRVESERAIFRRSVHGRDSDSTRVKERELVAE